jgi:phosphoribosylanthranilate isomerase
VVVKICGITTPEDAIAAAEAGATAVGFNFYPRSPRFVTPERAREMGRALPAGRLKGGCSHNWLPHGGQHDVLQGVQHGVLQGVLKVGVFVGEPADRVAEVMREAELDVAQVHGGEYPQGVRVWAAFRAGDSGLRDAMASSPAEAFLIDTPSETLRGGTGQTFDWSLAAGLPGRIVLAGGLDAGNVREAIRKAHPWGVDACSRLESAPGRKDHEKMRRFVEAALIEES